MNNQSTDADIPLVVDLDGTLIHTDLLYEGILMLLKKNPLYVFKFLLWGLKGKAYFKNEIFKISKLRYDLLPYNKELLNFLQSESSKGRKLILATASLKSIAQEIGEVYPIFDKIYGTEKVNLKGINKLKILTNDFDKSKFDYIGNSHSDLTIFSSSRFSYLVNPSKSLERKTRQISDLRYIWESQKPHLRDYIKAIRAYQWIKNLLIFVPLITSHRFYSLNLILLSTAAFFAFSFAASAGYVINDLLDLDADRAHPRKKSRPFASGKLSIPRGLILAFILLSGAMVIASQLNSHFLIILLGYFVISFSYSLYFKKIILFDVFILAFLYSTRIIAGGTATHISISFWLVSFSTFIFLSLAFVKRYSELMKITEGLDMKHRGREYRKEDLNLLQVMGIASGFLSVVVFSLYINSPEVRQLYSRPKILWTISFALLFWISHLWLITNRGEMTDDPIVYAIKDKISYLIFMVIGLIIFFSI